MSENPTMTEGRVMTDAEKLELVLELLNDLYALMAEIAPWVAMRLVPPEALLRWRAEHNGR